MVNQVLLPGKRLVAHVAAVRVVPAVLAHVVVEVLLARERLVAVLAFVRRISGVQPVFDGRRNGFEKKKETTFSVRNRY